MSMSFVQVKTVASVNLVFGLDWFAVLGGPVAREARRIARQHKASHVVHAGDDAASVGIAALPAQKRGTVMYSAAELVARRFSTGAVALILQLDRHQWWLVAVHEGAVIARTDQFFASFDDAMDGVRPLSQAYPQLVVMSDEAELPSLTDLVQGPLAGAELRRLTHGRGMLSRPYYAAVFFGLILYAGYRVLSGDILGWHDASDGTAVSADEAWQNALHELASRHWVHGVTGTVDVLISLYSLPVRLAGWRLYTADCVAQNEQWRCHADYGRDDQNASNAGFLEAAPASWSIRFTPLEQARVQWSLASSGRLLARTELPHSQHVERTVFSALQSIRPAFAMINIDAPELLPVIAPRDEQGNALASPPGLPGYRLRAVRIQAPLRSLSLLLPHADAMAWRRAVLSLDPQVRPDLTQSQLNVTLQGVLYEQD